MKDSFLAGKSAIDACKGLAPGLAPSDADPVMKWNKELALTAQ
ncbi:hypothetical protein CF149_18716 [Pseudomonas psychrophila]|jgi:hypothetical protein|nr:hypothetical protein CF149_18716 [Pseudomonas psychrophila]